MKLLTLAAIAALLAGCSAGSAAPAAISTPSASRTTSAPEPEPEPTETTYEPSKSDFRVDLKITRKKCYGSAGCNVTFKASLTYTGPLDLEELPEGTISVTYEVRGAEDPYTSTIDLEDGRYSPDEEMVSTSRSSAKLKAKVTDVEYSEA